MLTAAIHQLKRTVHGRPRLCRSLFNLATFNLDLARQQLAAGHFPSAHGGLRTDRDDYIVSRDSRLARAEIEAATAERLDSWRRDGFTVFRGAIAPDLIARYRAELEALKAHAPSPLLG